MPSNKKISNDIDIILLYMLLLIINKREFYAMKKYWNEKNTFNINSLERYAAGFPIDKNNIYRTKNLSGTWKFRFCSSVHDIPDDFGSVSFDYRNFDEIQVPSEWQIQGFDTPIYTNIAYPYALETKNFFKIPNIIGSKTSAGLYVCEFSVEKNTDNYFIHFGGVNSCAEVYLNGEFVGYSEDTFDFQEYNVTDLLKEGQNILSVIVYRYCTGSYLEDQDMWRLSGIFRDVLLINKPKYEIKDIFVKSKFNDNAFSSAILQTNIKLNSVCDKQKIEIKVFDKNENEVKKVSTNIASENTTLEEVFDNIHLWSHEDPYLYRIEFILYVNGIFCDKRCVQFGFREVKIVPMKDGRGPFILLNGKPVKFRGVNRHEFHPEYGHAVPAELIYKDLLLCKENNITAIRTSHYPNQKVFYDYCDKLGILVMCENNLETHGLSFCVPGNSPLWTKHCVYRIQNMVNTYKNHPCIVSWSLGNESGFGKSFVEMKKAVLAIDDTRFIHYEEDITGKVSDVFSVMYEPLEKMDPIGQNKTVMHDRLTVFKPLGVIYTPKTYKDLPFMECEYSHCMGNSLGNFSDYWEKFKEYDRLAGGFIWDFADQAIKYTAEDGTVEYRFGGDFGDKPNSGVFAFNGIVKADRSPNPALFEVKKQYQMADFKFDGKKVTLKNDYMFTDLKDYAIKTTYYADGEEIKSEKIILDTLLPEQSFEYTPNIPESEGEISFITELIPPLSEKNVAYEQFVAKKSSFVLPALTGNINYEETYCEIIVSDETTKYILDKESGGITSIRKGDREMLRNPIVPNFVRASIDNDRLASINIDFVKNLLGVYKFHKAQRTLAPKKNGINIVKAENGAVTVSIEWKYKYAKLFTDYVFGSEGIDFTMKIKPSCDLIRYGFKFETRKSIKDMTFYAKGPFENYCDRKTAAILKKYNGIADDFNHEYLSPQENGNHTEARYLTLGTEDNGLTVLAKNMPFEFGVLNYSTDMLEKATHAHELAKDDHYYITIDGKQRGVGGDVPAMAFLKKPYKIQGRKNYVLEFRLKIN